MFFVAEAYERQRGRSSKLLAPLFVDFVGVRGDVLDVGCGTGALTFAVAGIEAAARIVGVDPSEGFVAYARSQNREPRVSFIVGDAQNLPFRNAAFDRCLSHLVLNFIPNAPPGGTGDAARRATARRGRNRFVGQQRPQSTQSMSVGCGGGGRPRRNAARREILLLWYARRSVRPVVGGRPHAHRCNEFGIPLWIFLFRRFLAAFGRGTGARGELSFRPDRKNIGTPYGSGWERISWAVARMVHSRSRAKLGLCAEPFPIGNDQQLRKVSRAPTLTLAAISNIFKLS